MLENKIFLGIDGGGSKTTAVVFSSNGNFLGEVCGESINYYSVGLEKAREALADIINKLPEKEFDCVVIGMSALAERANKEETERFCNGIIKCDKIIMDSDLYVALEAMKVQGECAVIISGTGSMAICRNANGEISHAGGFGYILGDEGSGYSIALNSIKAAIRASEGCIPTTMLTKKCLEYFGINNVSELIDLYYEKGVSRKKTAAFAKETLLCAKNGDCTANNILKDEALALSQTALSLIKDKNPAIPIGLWGGVFQNNDIFKNHFIQALSSNGFNNVKLLDFTPEIGAIFACFRISELEAPDISENYKN